LGRNGPEIHLPTR
jgi:hypothetical protein